MTDRSRFAGLALAAPGLLGLLAAATIDRQATASEGNQAAQLPLPPANGEVGYVLTAIAPMFRKGDEQCPGGLTPTLKDHYLATQSPAERARLLSKENEPEFEKKWKAYAIGPGGINICTNAETFPQEGRQAAKMLTANVAPGMDLDGDASGKGGDDTCAHPNFTGEDGAQGVDNQAWRALGCTPYYRNVDGERGDLMTYLDTKLHDGEHTMVLLLRDVQSFVNDDHVTVILATTDDMPVTDTRRNMISGASFNVTSNSRWRNELTGRIVGGELLTEPADVKLGQEWGQGGARGQRAEYDMRKARIRAAFKPDGSIDGRIGSYQPIRSLMQSTILGGVGAAVVGNSDCLATYMALQRAADGIKDPKTGKCTAASSVNRLTAIPAFVFDRPPAGHKVARK